MNSISKDIDDMLKIRWLRHVLFWVGYVLMMSYIHSTGIRIELFTSWLANYLIELPVLAGLSYSVSYFLIPVFLRNKKYLLFVAGFFFCLLLFSAANVLLDQFIIYPYFFPERKEIIVFTLKTVWHNSFGMVFPVVIFVSISFMKYLNDRKEKLYFLSQNLQEKQLANIRAQIHPVFLRDVMNDLYIISMDHSNRLPEMILNISDNLHYLVYECNSYYVSLRQEEKAIRKYLGFEQLAYPQNKITIDVSGNPENAKIAPFILFSLTRAVSIFQKGDTSTHDHLAIEIMIAEQSLKFEATRFIHGEERNFDFEWKNEINIARKQLDTVYTWKHKLDVFETERKLHIILYIDFSP